MMASRSWSLAGQRPAMLRREVQPDGLAFPHRDVDGRDGAHCLPAGQGDEVVPVRAEIDLARDGATDPVGLPGARFGAREANVVMTDRNRGLALARELARPAAQRQAASAIDRVGAVPPALEDVRAADEAGDEFGAWSLVDVLGRAGLLDRALV